MLHPKIDPRSLMLQTWRKGVGLHIREVGDEIVVLDRERGQMHSLNAAAGLIFLEIDGSRALQDIAGSLAAFFELPRDKAEADTVNCVEQLRALGLVEEIPAGAV